MALKGEVFMNRKFGLKEIGYTILLVIIVLLSNFPILWTFKISIEPVDLIFKEPLRVIFSPTIQGYRVVLGEFSLFFFNSIAVALLSTLLSIIIGFPAAYSIARFNTGGENLSFWILSLKFIPPVAFLIPMYIWISSIGLLDNILGLVLVHLILNLPLTIWFLRSYIEEIPIENEEAAMVDGCSRAQAMFHITLPLTSSAIVATAVLAFITSWNEYLSALVLTYTRAKTWPVALAQFIGLFRVSYNELAAAAMIGMIPSIALAIIMRKHLVRGMTLGILK
jgi:multiple sugar transport system permease protein